MKPFLLATDYSEAARNAGDFAAHLAQSCGSELIVFHAWTPTLPAPETSPIVPLDDVRRIQKEAVEAEAARLSKAFQVRTRAIEQSGFAGDEIEVVCEEEGIGLIILATSHHNVVARFFGSVATSMLHKLKFPMLLVPEFVTFKEPQKVLLATDLHDSGDWHELDTLKAIARQLNFSIHIINVVNEKQVAGVEESSAGVRLENKLREIEHTWHFPVDEDIPHAVLETAERIGAGWIAMVPHQLPWYKELFHKSITKQLAFVTHRPLLALPNA
ncbi:MAG TPA: universal stress protein [Bacteroidia bacterium]|nr:universal stress protein [Bacteroidia bacterium]